MNSGVIVAKTMKSIASGSRSASARAFWQALSARSLTPSPSSTKYRCLMPVRG